MEFKERLKTLREENHWSQDELADRLKITKSAVSTYERGKNYPRFAVLDQMADVLDVDINYLLGNSDERGSYPRHGDAEIEAQVKTAEQTKAAALARMMGPKGYGFMDESLKERVDREYGQWLQKRSKESAENLRVYTVPLKNVDIQRPVARTDLSQIVNSYTAASPEVQQAVRTILGLK